MQKVGLGKKRQIVILYHVNWMYPKLTEMCDVAKICKILYARPPQLDFIHSNCILTWGIHRN